MKIKSLKSNESEVEVRIEWNKSGFKYHLRLKETWAIGVGIALLKLCIELWIAHH